MGDSSICAFSSSMLQSQMVKLDSLVNPLLRMFSHSLVICTVSRLRWRRLEEHLWMSRGLHTSHHLEGRGLSEKTGCTAISYEASLDILF